MPGNGSSPEPDPSPAPESVWNSLEVAKLCVGALTPLMIFLASAYISKKSSDQAVTIAQAQIDREHVYQHQQAIFKKRQEVWDLISKDLTAISDELYPQSVESSCPTRNNVQDAMERAERVKNTVTANSINLDYNFTMAILKWANDIKNARSVVLPADNDPAAADDGECQDAKSLYIEDWRAWGPTVGVVMGTV